jgi:deferrochelatase/peroxidase EfeB
MVANQVFTHGMKAAQAVLKDLPTRKWDESYRQRIDAMVLLADDSEHFLMQEARKVLDSVKSYADICTIEQGKVMRNALEYSVEHFGFVDGRSQPLFFESDIEWERQNGDGTHVWPPDAGLGLVLAPDPHGEEKDSTGKVVHQHSGSYLGRVCKVGSDHDTDRDEPRRFDPYAVGAAATAAPPTKPQNRATGS